MNKNFLVIASLSAALAVSLGAFAAHRLKQITTPDILAIFETAVRYQLYHTFALFITAILYDKFPGNLVRYAGNFFIAGIILFCGSLYTITAFKIGDVADMSMLGLITPFGGLSFIIGWLMLLLGVTRK